MIKIEIMPKYRTVIRKILGLTMTKPASRIMNRNKSESSSRVVDRTPIKIESIKIADDLNLFKFIDELRTPYSMVITPGSTPKNPDFIFNSINFRRFR